MRRVIVEGPDCSGKTTYVNWLAGAYGLKIIHLPRPDADFDFEHTYMNLLRINDDVVFDRFFYSEMVYGPIMRGICRISDRAIEATHQLMEDLFVQVHYMDTGMDELLRRLRARGDDYVNEQSLRLIKQKYDEVMRGAPNVIRIL